MRILFLQMESVVHDRIGVMCLSAALKQHGHEVKYIIVQEAGEKQLHQCMRDFAPSVVAYSMMTGEYAALMNLNRRLKEQYPFHAVFGGPHPTFYQDLIHEDGCDALCIGEGDYAFPEFCNRLEHGEAYWETPNFIVRKNGDIHRNPLLPLIEDLDALPFPDRELMYEADPGIRGEGRKSFLAGRGCPYMCTYCFNNKYNRMFRGNGPVLRHHSPERLVAEVQAVREKYFLDWVAILDDTFMIRPPGWVGQFCNEYKKRIGLPFGCCARANLVTEDLIAQLKGAGLDMCGMGVECADEKIANSILNRNISNDELLGAAKILHRHQVKLMTFSLLGLPVKEPYKTDLKTLELNIEIRPTFAWASLLYPYPGTEVGDYVREHGFLPKNASLLETNKRSSLLDFGSEQEKRRIENLHKLYGLIVKFPALKRIGGALCELPQNKLYLIIYYLFYGYCFKVKLWPYRSFWREIWKYMRLFVRMIQKS